jgi:hypothetical protein
MPATRILKHVRAEWEDTPTIALRSGLTPSFARELLNECLKSNHIQRKTLKSSKFPRLSYQWRLSP